MKTRWAVAMIVGAAWLLQVPRAGALRIRTTVSLLAWSADGESVLLREREHGPEGGGSEAYAVVGTRPVRVLRATVSSDFSPGGSARPQRVPLSACRDGLRQVARALGKLGFRGVKVYPSRCARKGRHGLVEVEATVRRTAERSLLGEGPHVKGRGIAVSLHQGKVIVGPGTGPARAGGGAVAPALAPSGKVLVVIRATRDGDRLLAGVYRSDSGKPESFGRVQLRRPKGGKW